MVCSICDRTGHKAPTCVYKDPPPIHVSVNGIGRLCDAEHDPHIPRKFNGRDKVKERPLCSGCSTEYLIRFGEVLSWHA